MRDAVKKEIKTVEESNQAIKDKIEAVEKSIKEEMKAENKAIKEEMKAENKATKEQFNEIKSYVLFNRSRLSPTFARLKSDFFG